MSEEVESTPVPPPAEILPAKSEDKLIIEKEEKESEEQEQKTDEKTEEVVEKDDKTEEIEPKKDETEDVKEAEEDKKDESAAAEEGDADKDAEESKGARARKKFKLPNIELKAPKVPGFIRAISKERKKVG